MPVRAVSSASAKCGRVAAIPPPRPKDHGSKQSLTIATGTRKPGTHRFQRLSEVPGGLPSSAVNPPARIFDDTVADKALIARWFGSNLGKTAACLSPTDGDLVMRHARHARYECAVRRSGLAVVAGLAETCGHCHKGI